MTGIIGSITFSAAAREVKLPLRRFELEAARHECEIGAPARVGPSRVLSAEQWAKLKRLIEAKGTKGGQDAKQRHA